MKRIITCILAITLLVTALPLTLASCSPAMRLKAMDESRRAAAFYTMIGNRADRASSNSLNQTMTLIMDINGMTYEQVTEGTITFIGEKDDFTYLEQFETTVRTDNMVTIMQEDRGYADGTMFLYYKTDGGFTKMKSSITPDEYNSFMAEQNADNPQMQVGEGYCETMTCVQNEDKTWTATYEDFTEEGMKPFYKMLEGIEYAITADHSLKGVRLTCSADADLYPTEFLIDFLFEENPEAESRVPTVTVKNTYTGWNNTILAHPYDLSDFTEVEDVRYVERFMTALQDRETADAGSVDITTDATSRYDDQTEKTVTTQSLAYRTVDGVELDMKYNQFGYDYRMIYRNGRMTTSVYEEGTENQLQSQATAMSDFEAQAIIQQMVNSESIRAADIVNAKQTDAEKGTYHFTLGNAVKSKMNEQYQSVYGSTIDEFRGHIDATVVDGELKSYIYSVYTTLEVDGTRLEITVYMTVTFGEFKADSENI